jgi:hypothetical protein
MTRFVAKWCVNPLKVPDTPEEAAKLHLSLLGDGRL